MLLTCKINRMFSSGLDHSKCCRSNVNACSYKFHRKTEMHLENIEQFKSEMEGCPVRVMPF